MIKPGARRSRRLRKKLFTGEYRVLGAECRVRFSRALLEAEIENFWDQLVALLGTMELQFGGGGAARVFSGFITAKGRYGGVTQEQLEKLDEWLKAQLLVASVEISEPMDAYYGCE
ncbi:50S ribosome-binding protein YggL [Aestuariirhabdus sp. LZHN29]|uniref:50S ribosome-binding protein YggL n=1 Tax=Aestuariirhabdus sp. LZHN29 TaxID=3417462 RepID=UPI003CEA5A18